MKSIYCFLMGHKKDVNISLENYKVLKNHFFLKKRTEIKGTEVKQIKHSLKNSIHYPLRKINLWSLSGVGGRNALKSGYISNLSFFFHFQNNPSIWFCKSRVWKTVTVILKFSLKMSWPTHWIGLKKNEHLFKDMKNVVYFQIKVNYIHLIVLHPVNT